MRRNNVIRFRRGARRSPRRDMGTPPDQRNPSRLRRIRHRPSHADPTSDLKATWALRRMLWQADRVRFVRSGTDRYVRALVTMTLGGAPVARRVIDAGLARPYAGGARQGWCDA